MNVRPLVRTLLLFEGETQTSYVSRLAAYHGTSPRDFSSDLGMRWPSICSGRDNHLAQLARLTGASFDQLKFWSPVKMTIGRYKVGATVSSVGAFRRTAIRVCPLCALEAGGRDGPSGFFQLLEWSVTCLHRCATHGVALCTLPAAPTSHETYDVVGQLSRHITIVNEAAARAQVFESNGFETYVRHRVYQGSQDDWLRTLDLTHLHRACLTLGAMIELDLSRFRSGQVLMLSGLPFESHGAFPAQG